jgi:hypothetical protein
MSQLPQRRKTSEEIARLRESLAVSDIPHPPAPVLEPAPPVAAHAPTPLPPQHEPPHPVVLHDAHVNHTEEVPEDTEAPPTVIGGERWVHSLKKSEQGPIIVPVHPQEESPTGRWVHSLRKSEQGPVVVPVIEPADCTSKIPTSRHSEREMLEMKRRGLMSVRPPVPYLLSITAHPVILMFGYLLALAGGVGGILVALFIFLRKRRSMHHAGFMVAIAGLVLVFGSLYFRELQELWYEWFPEYLPK